MKLTLEAFGDDTPDLENALREALRLVEAGFTSGQNKNDSGSFSFDITEETGE